MNDFSDLTKASFACCHLKSSISSPENICFITIYRHVDIYISFSPSEQEADAEEERLRKERENRKKQHAMTLEETRDTIVKMEQGLTDLKNQKHQLFQDLKVVLNEDATRKRAQQQQNYLKER